MTGAVRRTADTTRNDYPHTREGAMRWVTRWLAGDLALILAFTIGGCAYPEARSAGHEVPPVDTASGRTGGGDRGGGGGGY